MKIYFNLSHLINRIKGNRKFKNFNLNNNLILKFLGNGYNLDSPVDTFILYKLSLLINSNLFDFMNDELYLQLNLNQIPYNKSTFVDNLKNKITTNQLNDEQIKSSLSFHPFKPSYNAKKVEIGKVIQFFIYFNEPSLYEFSIIHNLKIKDILQTFNRTDLEINELIIWSKRLDINLLNLLSLYIDSRLQIEST